MGYALRRADDDAAREVVSETFAVAWRRLDDVPADPLPWLLGVARRALANRRRGDAEAVRAALVAWEGLAADAAPLAATGPWEETA